MRGALENLLFHRYPVLYRDRDEPRSRTLMSFGFTHGDGWFAIVDVLSQLVTQRSRRALAFQVKEKLGGLRFYLRSADDFIGGAAQLAERYSYKVSELSGRPGLLQINEGYYRTLAVGERPGYEPVPGAAYPALGAGLPGALDRLRDRHRLHVPGGSDVPDGWADLVDEFIQAQVARLSRDDRGPDPAALAAIATAGDGTLVVTWAGEPTLEQRGQAEFARAMARRIDPASGAIGPVDDAGLPEWAR